MIRALRQEILLGLFGLAIGTGFLHHASPLPFAKRLLHVLSIG